MTTLFIGISCFYHDSAASIALGSEIIFSEQEERHSRVKGDNRFPTQSLLYGLNSIDQSALTSIHEINICYYENPNKKFLRATYGALLSRSLDTFSKVSSRYQDFNTKQIVKKLSALVSSSISQSRHSQFLESLDLKVSIGDHHRSHLYSSIVPSGFSSGVGLVLDGIGEFRSCSIFTFSEHGASSKLVKCRRFPHSLGLTYSAISSLLGFKVNSGEYKLMGLAPYGKPLYTDLILENIVTPDPDKLFTCNPSYLDFCSGGKLWKDNILELFELRSRRLADEEIQEKHLNIAASLQQATELIFKNILSVCSDFGDNLVYSGGVALNCKANRFIPKYFKNHFIQPASNDAGGSLGAIYAVAKTHSNPPLDYSTNSIHPFNPYLGTSASEEDCYSYALENGFKEEPYDSSQGIEKSIAKLLANGNIVARYSGRSEYGPRALGNRSILADPGCIGMQQRLNIAVKKREGFRPFAPIVNEEDFVLYFSGQKNYHMLMTSRSKTFIQPQLSHPSYLLESILNSSLITDELFPSAVHVDGSARVQCVNNQMSPSIHLLLNEFKSLKKYGVLLNTSFNLRGEPIVRSFRDALHCFQYTDIDYLWLENKIYTKSASYCYPESHFSPD